MIPSPSSGVREATGRTRQWLSTVDCARIMNELLEMPGAYSEKAIRGEIRRGRLVARVNTRKQKRTRFGIHRDDFRAWASPLLPPSLRDRLAS